MSDPCKYPHIVALPGEPACLERLPRIRVAQIAMDHVFYSWTAEDILRQHDYLTPSEVHAALGYYFDHREQIDREIESETAQARLGLKSNMDTPLAARLAAFRFQAAA